MASRPMRAAEPAALPLLSVQSSAVLHQPWLHLPQQQEMDYMMDRRRGQTHPDEKRFLECIMKIIVAYINIKKLKQ